MVNVLTNFWTCFHLNAILGHNHSHSQQTLGQELAWWCPMLACLLFRVIFPPKKLDDFVELYHVQEGSGTQ